MKCNWSVDIKSTQIGIDSLTNLFMQCYLQISYYVIVALDSVATHSKPVGCNTKLYSLLQMTNAHTLSLEILAHVDKSSSMSSNLDRKRPTPLEDYRYRRTLVFDDETF